MSVPARNLSYEASSYSSLNQRPHKAAQKSSKSFKCLTMSTVNLGRTYLDTHTVCGGGGRSGGRQLWRCNVVYNVFIYGTMCHWFFFAQLRTDTEKNTRDQAATGRRSSGGSGWFWVLQKHRRTVSAKSRPTTCLLIERKIISCYKFLSVFLTLSRVQGA